MKINKLLIVLIMLFISLMLNMHLYTKYADDNSDNIINEIIIEGNITYENTLENYYNVEYENEGKGLKLKINNPCIIIQESKGLSMKPYWDNLTLNIFDTCFPKEDLEIGDVIAFWEDGYGSRIQHRIIDIDYEKEWVRTQGDNNNTNEKPDDFTSFDKIYAKNIGVLNVLEDKKIVKKEIINESNNFWSNRSLILRFSPMNYTCICSSNGILSLCDSNKTKLYEDSFVKQSGLKEEYCKNE